MSFNLYVSDQKAAVVAKMRSIVHVDTRSMVMLIMTINTQEREKSAL